jgi:hypothetical protein
LLLDLFNPNYTVGDAFPIFFAKHII